MIVVSRMSRAPMPSTPRCQLEPSEGSHARFSSNCQPGWPGTYFHHSGSDSASSPSETSVAQRRAAAPAAGGSSMSVAAPASGSRMSAVSQGNPVTDGASADGTAGRPRRA